MFACVLMRKYTVQDFSVLCNVIVEAAKWNNKNQSKQECVVVCLCVCVCVCMLVCVCACVCVRVYGLYIPVLHTHIVRSALLVTIH